MTSAINFAKRIVEGDTQQRDKYIEFLKSGSKDYSINILKNAGVDLASNEPYEVMSRELSWAINEFEKLLFNKGKKQ